LDGANVPFSGPASRTRGPRSDTRSSTIGRRGSGVTWRRLRIAPSALAGASRTPRGRARRVDPDPSDPRGTRRLLATDRSVGSDADRRTRGRKRDAFASSIL